MSEKFPNLTDEDHLVFPESHDFHSHIVYDSIEHEYYNIRGDLFLTEDDIKFYKLRPYSHITTPLPTPLPENYWLDWN